MERDLFKALSIATLCSFMLAFASCANENIVQKKTDTDNNDKNLTTFATGTAPESAPPWTITRVHSTGRQATISM